MGQEVLRVSKRSDNNVTDAIEVARLLEIGRLKLYADHALLASITQKSPLKVDLVLSPKAKLSGRDLLQATSASSVGAIYKDESKTLALTWQPQDAAKLLPELSAICERLMLAQDNTPVVEENADEK